MPDRPLEGEALEEALRQDALRRKAVERAAVTLNEATTPERQFPYPPPRNRRNSTIPMMLRTQLLLQAASTILVGINAADRNQVKLAVQLAEDLLAEIESR